MNRLTNTVQLIGRLGADPIIRTFDKNKKLATFSLATTDEYYNKAGEKVKDTQWHSLVVWGGLADVCEKYLTKGKEIAVEGKLGYRVFTDKDNNRRFVTEINVNDILMMSDKSAAGI